MPPAGELVALARTPDQARAILAFIDSLAERRARSVTTLTAPRGRGKSAALGLCLAAAVATGYASIFVTAPAVDNVATVFEFLLKGLEALHYDEKTDYEVLKHKTESGVDVPRASTSFKRKTVDPQPDKWSSTCRRRIRIDWPTRSSSLSTKRRRCLCRSWKNCSGRTSCF